MNTPATMLIARIFATHQFDLPSARSCVISRSRVVSGKTRARDRLWLRAESARARDMRTLRYGEPAARAATSRRHTWSWEKDR